MNYTVTFGLCRKLHHRLFVPVSKEFETAEIKQKRAELTSNVDTSDEEVSPAKRKRQRKQFSSSSSDEDTSVVKRPPPLKIKKVAARSPSVKELQDTCQKAAAPQELQNTRQELVNPSIQIDAKAYQTLLQKLTGIQQQNTQILALLEENKNCTAINGDSFPDFPVTIPITSDEDLSVLELFLENHANVVICFLTRIGGETVFVKTNRILKYILSDNLAIAYSFYGKRDKKEFRKLKLFSVIRGMYT
uniref:Uncharacterized protein LOC114339292 n=1 Tax=Diabrotica virgifera virgifera TaxID=50390 RepID=A0A6P7G946_DIAVI